MPKKISKAVHVMIADIHVGSKLGLCPPEAKMDLGSAYKPNPWQLWMWKCWELAWDWVEDKIKEINPSYTHLSILGDMCDIDLKNRSDQIWSRSQTIVKDCVIEIMEPIINKMDTVMVIKGTEAHNGLSNQTEDLIAKDFDNHVPCDETGEAAWWSADVELGGVLFNLAHHGRMGYRKWTKKNPLYALRADIILDRVDDGLPVPDVAARGHFHQFHHTDENEKCMVVQLPGWQLKTAFVNRIDAVDTRPSVGVVLFDCQDGKYNLYAKTYRMPRSEPWNPETKSSTKKKLFQALRLGN